MGIERYVTPTSPWGGLACKKSPQTWGLKVESPEERAELAVWPCKKSPQTWGLKDLFKNL